MPNSIQKMQDTDFEAEASFLFNSNLFMLRNNKIAVVRSCKKILKSYVHRFRLNLNTCSTICNSVFSTIVGRGNSSFVQCHFFSGFPTKRRAIGADNRIAYLIEWPILPENAFGGGREVGDVQDVVVDGVVDVTVRLLVDEEEARARGIRMQPSDPGHVTVLVDELPVVYVEIVNAARLREKD